jgi:hypothetical protein
MLSGPGLLAQEATGRAELPKTHEPIVIDGDVSDAGWHGALKITTFYETTPADNAVPPVNTVAYVTYDDRYFYVAVVCDDPHPDRIRAPYVDRDAVLGTDDNVAIFLDTLDDHRTAMEFRVNPRGIQGDALYNDATSTEDFSPDFFYDSSARITEHGWTAELRIPFATLRYQRADHHTFGIVIWRNYPRDFRYGIYSSKLPRGSNCLVCHELELTGLAGLPEGGHIVAAPYATAQQAARPQDDPQSGLASTGVRMSGGLDAKWTPRADTAVDATIRPDFSQIESDVGQLSVNTRFALFFPEKRPFFLEGVDLLQTPMTAVYTRSITSPEWGARTTGKIGSSAYTVLVSQDRGGGSVIVPGPVASTVAPEDFQSTVGIARVRQDFGKSFVGLLYTGRNIEGGGGNHVAGPDFVWRPNDRDQVTGQLLVSDTRNPNRPDLTPAWRGERYVAGAARVSWQHTTEPHFLALTYSDIGSGFRAFDGFIPQVGIREGLLQAGYNFYPTGIFRFLRPTAIIDYAVDRSGVAVKRQTYPALVFQGTHDLSGEVDYFVAEQIRVGDRLLNRSYANFTVLIDPSRRVSRVGLQGHLGQDVDVVNARQGVGGEIGPTATIRPLNHLGIELNSDVQWLSVPVGPAGQTAHLFTAEIERIKTSYYFTPKSFVRTIVQYEDVRRETSVYTTLVRPRDRSLSTSALFSYQVNWQTVLFAGYQDDRVDVPAGQLHPSGRQIFVKVSYALQR